MSLEDAADTVPTRSCLPNVRARKSMSSSDDVGGFVILLPKVGRSSTSSGMPPSLSQAVWSAVPSTGA